MSDVPERIWAFKPDIFDNCSVWQDAPSPAGDAIEYVLADRIEELEAKLAKAVEALGILADDTNWFDAVEEDGTLSPAWRGTGSPDEIARATLKELTGGTDGN